MRKGAARHTKAPPGKRPARKSCGAPSESRPSRKPQSTQPESWLARKPITASDEHAKPQTGTRKRSENHQISWRIARPNAVMVVSAIYENDQTLPLPSMYGKNLIFKTGGVDATGLEEPLSLIEQGLIDTSCLISKRYALNDILEAYRAFEAREDGCLKVVITPWEERYNKPQPKRRLEGHDKGPDYPMKGGCANRSAIKVKNRGRQCYGPTNS